MEILTDTATPPSAPPPVHLHWRRRRLRSIRLGLIRLLEALLTRLRAGRPDEMVLLPPSSSGNGEEDSWDTADTRTPGSRWQLVGIVFLVGTLGVLTWRVWQTVLVREEQHENAVATALDTHSRALGQITAELEERRQQVAQITTELASVRAQVTTLADGAQASPSAAISPDEITVLWQQLALLQATVEHQKQMFGAQAQQLSARDTPPARQAKNMKAQTSQPPMTIAGAVEGNGRQSPGLSPPVVTDMAEGEPRYGRPVIMLPADLGAVSVRGAGQGQP